MRKEAAKNLIKETFNSSFDKERFTNFTRNLFNSVEEDTFVYRGNYIPDAYDEYVKTLERIAKFKDAEGKTIDVLIVSLKKETSLEYARTMQRNFIAWYLDGSRGGEQKDAAFVAFVSPNEEDWRLSLVKMDYTLAKTKSGKIKAEKELSPARRWSFLVGEHENSHTAQKQFLPLLEEEGQFTLAQLENAFSIEIVTKEFFERYRELFGSLVEELHKIAGTDKKVKAEFQEGAYLYDQEDISDTEKYEKFVVNFAKKLLGQIVFLYFLQKKGWFGVPKGQDWGEGDKRFLRNLFIEAEKDNKNYFNDYLEPLFYDALAIDRSHIDHWIDQFQCNIPFLNGGLFDPIGGYAWQKTDINLSNKIFSNSDKTKQGDVGTGILDVFDRYNFTVKEDEPLEKDVAVDPEMLGKVFENLLEVKDRKSKGTYYTPREIVHYMCQESLIAHLETELEGTVNRDDIETLVKYGEAFVEHDTRVSENGKETSRYSYKLPKSVRKNAKLIDEKLEKIRVCDPAVGSGAFLVGMMSEVVRTRNALTLHLKEKKERSMYNLKRHAIQSSLYGVDIDAGAVEIAKLRLWLSLIVDESEFKEIQPLPNLDYKIVAGNSLLSVEKNSLFLHQDLDSLKDLKRKYFNETSTKKKEEYKKQIDELISKITDGHKEFDFEIYFSEVFQEQGGFDVVIANPPYINVNEMKEKETEVYRKLFITPFGSYDIYILFFEKSIEILKGRGILTHITSNKYFIADYAKKLREFITANTKILTLLDLADCKRVFEYALVSPAITVLQKEKEEDYSLELGLLRDEDINKLGNIQMESLDISELISGMNFVFDIHAGGENKTILKKLRSGTTKLESIAHVRTGVMGFEYWRMESFIREGNYAGHIRIITNGQINRYAFVFNKKVNLYKKVFRNPHLDVEKAPINENTKRLFLQKKIIIRGVARKLSAQFDDEGFGVLVAVHTAIPKDPNYNPFYLLALLNSSLFNWYHIAKFYTARIPMGSLKYPISFLKQLPIKAISTEQQKPLIELVDKILTITKDEDYLQNEEKQKDVQQYEEKINQMIYEIYGLTKEEVRIVEKDS